jgi:hypothetical protein
MINARSKNMGPTIHDFIAQVPIVDVHEHHIPEILLNRDVNLLQIFQQSYAGWAQARPYPLPSETRTEDPMLSATRATTWEALAPYLENSGSNSFVRNLVGALSEIYEIGDGEITRENWWALDAAIRERHQDPNWRHELTRRAGIERFITDPYTDPLLNARHALGPNYDSVMRINAFAVGWHPASRDHNGTSAHALLARLNLKPSSFDDYIGALETVVSTMRARNAVALKNALAYPRTRFLLMHLAYPWSRELLGMAFVYRNAWLDLTWSWLLSPSHFKQALHEAIESLSDESRMMLGGDNWHIEETYGTLKLARRLVGEVLEQKIGEKYFGPEAAERLAKKIFRTNALEFFKLD